MKLLIRMIVSTLMIIAIWVVLGTTLACGCTPIPEQPSISSLRADLRDLARAEQLYRKDHGRYSGSLTDLAFTSSNGSPVAVFASTDGFFAFTPTLGRSGWRCVLAVGSFVGDSLRDGEPRCQVLGEPLRPLPARRR